MNKQQKEIQKLYLDQEEETLEKLKENYQNALESVNEKLSVLMSRQDADMPHVIHQVQYQNSLKKQINEIIDNLHKKEYKTVSEYLKKSYDDGFIGTMYDLQKQGIPLVIPIDQRQVADAINHETKLSENLYTKLGKDTKKLSKQIAVDISRGISTNQTYKEISGNIRRNTQIARNNAMRIARTESHRIRTKAAADAQYKAREKGADVVKQWDASLDERTRDTHRLLDGQIRELDDPFEVEGKKAMRPGDFGLPEEDINCRCVLCQRARWALGGEYTKWDPKAPVLTSDDGTTQYVNLSDAKNYKKFKEWYNESLKKAENVDVIQLEPNNHRVVTKEWFDNAEPGKGKIFEAEKYDAPDGNTYIVDGINVKQNNSQKEIEVGKLLHDTFGGEIQYIPEVNGKYNGVKTPDYIWKNERWDLKELSSTKDEAIRNAIHKKSEQADNFIIDISNNSLSNDKIIEQASNIFEYENTSFVNRIIILRNNAIVEVLERK